MLKTLLQVLISFFPLWSFAKIDYRTGAYLTSAVDAEIIKGGFMFQLRRSYNSRSLHSGVFGFGWCSDFEKTLDLRTKDRLILKDCRIPLDRVYEKRRSGYFVNMEDPLDIIIFADKEYRRKTAGGWQRYSARGQLSSLSDQNGFTLRILYDDDDHLSRLKLSFFPDLVFKLDPSRRRIISITQSHKVIVRYRYDHADLSSAEIVSDTYPNLLVTAITSYRYDDVHNLTAVDKADHSSESILYDTRRDLVLSVRDSLGCSESLLIGAKSPARKSRDETVISLRKCINGKPESTLHRYAYTQGGPVHDPD
jgi:YD repeat-containing protein